MRDITDQLREWSRTLADSVPPTDLEGITSPMTTTPASHTNRRWLAVAASVAIVAAGIFALVTLGSDSPDRITPATNPQPATTDGRTMSTTEPSAPTTTEPEIVPVSPSSTSTTTTISTISNSDDRLEAWPAPPATPVPAADIVRLLPSEPIPVAGVPVRAEAEGGSAAPPTFTQVFVDADREILLTLVTQPGGTDNTPVELRQPVTIEGWDDAFVTEPGALWLVASDPSGFIRLTSNSTGIDADEAVLIVADMQRRNNGRPGWDLPPAWSDLTQINEAWDASAGQRSLTWYDGTRIVAEMLTSPSHTHQIGFALSPSFEQVDINGSVGWLNPRRSIVWSPDGTTIVVLGVADDRIDPLALARSVTEVGVADYESGTTNQFPPGIGDGCNSLFC